MCFSKWICFLLFIIVFSENDFQVDAFHEIFPDLQSVRAVKVDNVHRTAYHFQPPAHWINDPNGPMIYKGIYHLFYQYNPQGSVWGNIVWAHSVSKDLINWEALEPAIVASKPFDIGGAWSGSATILPDKGPVILYTGLDKNETQLQNYAVPADLSDPNLVKWNKPNDNPIIRPDMTMNRTAFRDPTTAWFSKDRHWRMVVGSRRNHRGMAYLYKSRDFLRWVKVKHPIHSQAGTGMWECPDFYPVAKTGENGLDMNHIGDPDVKYVFKVSLDLTRYEYYTIGTFDPKRERYTPDADSVDGWSGLRTDYGNYYASKSFFDDKTNRRINWGWANESDTSDDDVRKGWAGVMTIPRTVLLDPNGKQLLFWPIKEIETLRGNKVEMKNEKLLPGSRVEVTGVEAAQADVEVTFSIGSLDKAEPFDSNWTNPKDLCGIKGSTVQGGVGPFGLITLATSDLEEYTPVFFRVFKGENNKHVVLMCSDATRSSKKDYKGMYKPSFAGFVNVDLSDKKISLRSLIDHSVVESFGANGKTCITSRVYPEKAVFENAHLYVFNNGTEPIVVDNLNAWNMKMPLKMNN